ncbi:hypothetical protein GGH94_005821 [Coemansia aciculifera]|uniref:Uncharacterized protein n=1 Tax=Coemansia aciculifera TaxID=417176 RepID=A0A9W8IFD2_9FUNG|nr:hypothetical protein GGH94_005821 [Coemansia aciculifera]KAJ2876475.1 hypothetical protein GGH93_000696 [Coemansia aciculifera]
MNSNMRTDGNWMKRLCWRILRVKAMSASEHATQKEQAMSATASLSEVRIVHVGKDTCAGSWSDYRHDYSDVHSLPFFGHDYADMSEDVVPYLDDCHEEKIAAHLLRHQSLLRRNLHRMSLLLVRQPAELPHIATLDAAAY